LDNGRSGLIASCFVERNVECGFRNFKVVPNRSLPNLPAQPRRDAIPPHFPM
jgi:hypothetical protein